MSFPTLFGGSIGRRLTKNSCMSRERLPPDAFESRPEIDQPVLSLCNSKGSTSLRAASPSTAAAAWPHPRAVPEDDKSVDRPAPCPRILSARTWKRMAGWAMAYAWIKRKVVLTCALAFLRNSRCLTGILLKSSRTETVVPTSRAAGTWLTSFPKRSYVRRVAFGSLAVLVQTVTSPIAHIAASASPRKPNVLRVRLISS
mmetsp:Transcript_154121/g.279892  ORF Transcript_154121/g.279892 Transcript_154121/m.279892 type:complete len:200 (+) Transcript_154121:2246-2845(+)